MTTYSNIRPSPFNEHDVLIDVTYTPSWFDRVILREKPSTTTYTGRRTVWHEVPSGKFASSWLSLRLCEHEYACRFNHTHPHES